MVGGVIVVRGQGGLMAIGIVGTKMGEWGGTVMTVSEWGENKVGWNVVGR
jgi:hypothetical protein